MTWPRASAMAEVAWTMPEHKNLDDFERRLEQEYKRFAADGINYSKSAYDPHQENDKETGMVKLSNDAWKSKIYYTTDGSEPTTASLLYTKPFAAERNTVIKSAVFIEGKKAGKTLEKRVGK